MFLATECVYFRLNMWSHLFYVLYVTGSASFVTWHICSTFTPVCHQFYKKYAWTWRKTLCICRSSSDHSLGSIVMVAKVFFLVPRFGLERWEALVTIFTFVHSVFTMRLQHSHNTNSMQDNSRDNLHLQWELGCWWMAEHFITYYWIWTIHSNTFLIALLSCLL